MKISWWDRNVKIWYSLTSLSRPSISHQTRFSPTVAVERMFQHSIYLIKSPPSHLALAKPWNDNDPCKLHLISHHFITVQLAEWSVSVKVGVRMSLAAASCSDPRHLFPIAVHCAVSVSATLPLIMSLPLPMTRLQSRLMRLWLISGAAVLIRYAARQCLCLNDARWIFIMYELGVTVLTERCCYSNVFEEKTVCLTADQYKKEICIYHSNNWFTAKWPLFS